jgi:hypothetical protein
LTAARPYFHGTASLTAARALAAGQALAPAAPPGRQRLSGGMPGRVYLTPSAAAACGYSRLYGRHDRPRFGDWRDCDGRGFVFRFDLSGAALEVEEDDLGNACRVAAEVLDLRWHDGWHDEGWPRHPNRALGAALARDHALLRLLRAAAATLLPPSLAARLSAPRPLGMAEIARIGRALSPRLPADLSAALIGAGSSVATAARPVAEAGWQTPRAMGYNPTTEEGFFAVAAPLAGPRDVDEVRPTRGESFGAGDAAAVVASAEPDGDGWAVTAADGSLWHLSAPRPQPAGVRWEARPAPAAAPRM